MERPERELVEAMPERLYWALPFPANTAKVCHEAVSRAVRTQNPRRIYDWIDGELAAPAGDTLLECLELVLRSTFGLRPSRERESILQTIRAEAASRIVKHQKRRRLAARSRGAEPVVTGIQTAIAAYDASLTKHAAAVEALAQGLAEFAGLSEDTIALVSLAARVHEIGKLRLGSQHLTSTQAVDAATRARMRICLRSGAEALSEHETLRGIAHIVAACYDDVDVDMPIESRVIALADAFVTMGTARPYRTALSPEASITELLRLRGSRFDSGLTDTLVAMLESTRSLARSA